jgi:four helix bundle protein
MRYNFKELMIWTTGMEITDLIYAFGKTIPEDERWNLQHQMNKCSCSIPSNIAEGSGKMTEKHFAEFLSIALSSAFELETQLLICQRRRYGDARFVGQIIDLVVREQKMIYNFRSKILKSNSFTIKVRALFFGIF